MLEGVLGQTLGIKKEETVLIVTDSRKRDVSELLKKAAEKLSDEVILLEMGPREHNGQEPPEAISMAMESSDVVILATTMSLTHTEARKSANKKGTRIASMPGITTGMLDNGGLVADYGEVKKLSERVAGEIKRAEKIRITTKKGTDFEAVLGDRRPEVDSGDLRERGKGGNLPAGEAFIAPLEGKSGGILVFDGSFAGLGVLKNPVKILVKNGKIGSVKGEDGKLMNKLKGYEKGDYIAEIGIGTNPKAKITGNVLEDEKVMGTVHIAFGDNHTFGGKIRTPIHLDGVIKSPSIYLDDRMLMEEGIFLES